MKERLQKIIAAAGLASRRKAEQMIVEGRVRVNGEVVTELGTTADAGKDDIEVDGLDLPQPENRVYLMLHKPAGTITALSDPEKRPTVMNLVSDIPERIFPVGRLDYDTEGLLLLTNDGGFAQILQHPSHDIDRKYLVKVKAVPGRFEIDRLRKGIVLDGVKTYPARIKLAEKTPRNCWLEVVLKEGRNRQIKKMFESVGHRTLRIIRTEFGPLTLGNLPAGTYRFLKKSEIESIKKLKA